MTVKRSASSSPPASETETKPTTPKKVKKSTTPKSSPVKSEDGTNTVDGQWTGEKKGQLVEHLFAVAFSNSKIDELASKFGVSEQQMRNMIGKKKGKLNLRAKMVALASEQ